VIAVRLMGGLGNQMFQYAAGRRLADLHSVDLVLDLSHFADQPAEEVPRQFELDCFRIRAELSETRIATTSSLLGRLIRPGRLRLLREKHFPVQHRVLLAEDETLLYGYWQSEQYFVDDGEAIRRDFTLRRPLSPRKQAIADLIDENAVALQVRRGDYATHPPSMKFHGLMPLDYYRRAADRIVQFVPSPHFLVVSDDPTWCQEHLGLGHPTTVVDRTVGGDHEDLMLMSMCHHHVIANSSFGWWGSWLATNPHKKVIAPRRWFTNPEIDTRDLTPEGWILL
jgi:hypothetical protein